MAKATKEVSSLKVKLQVKTDMVHALKLKYENESEELGEITTEDKTEEGPLAEEDSKCDKCSFKSKNRVLLAEHKETKHKKLRCLMCGKI